MKIAVLAAFHSLDKGWSCPLSLINQLESMGHQVIMFNLYQLNNENVGVSYTDNGLKKFLDQQNDFDLFLHMDYGMFYSPLLKDVKIPSIGEMGDDPQAFSRNLPKANFFDLVFSPDKRCVQQYKNHGIKAVWLTHWADPSIHMPISDIVPDKFVVTTCETGRGNGMINIMRQQLGGDIWLDDRYYYAFEHTKFMHRGHVVFQKSQWGEITRRPFEAAACRKMVMLDELEADTGIKNIFRDGVDAVYYHSWEDAVDKINYYKSRLDEVADIAKSGYERVISGHTVEHRANRILDLVETL